MTQPTHGNTLPAHSKRQFARLCNNEMPEDEMLSFFADPKHVYHVISTCINRGTIESRAHGIFAALSCIGRIHAPHGPTKFEFTGKYILQIIKEIEHLLELKVTERSTVVIQELSSLYCHQYQHAENIIEIALLDMSNQGWHYEHNERFVYDRRSLQGARRGRGTI